MAQRVAIAGENGDFDVEVYRYLLERLLGQPVQAWQPGAPAVVRFSGWRSVVSQCPTYLRLAERATGAARAGGRGQRRRGVATPGARTGPRRGGPGV